MGEGCDVQVLGVGIDSGDSMSSAAEVLKGSLRGVGGGTWNFSGVSHFIPFSELGLWALRGGLGASSRGVLAAKGCPPLDFRNGIEIVTVVPCPGSVLITILPSLSLTNRAATARPRPMDAFSPSRLGGASTSSSSSSTFSKSWNMPSSSGLGRC